MKKYFTTAVCIIISTLLFSCASVAPVNTSFEKAGTLGKGNIELAGSYTHYSYTAEGESGPVNNNYGLKAGIGLSDKFDLKARYERLVPADEQAKEALKVNYFSLIPKFNIVQNKFSFMMPVSMYNFKEEGSGYNSTYRNYSIAPQLIHTVTNRSNTADVSLSARGDFRFSDDFSENDVLVGFNLGTGISNNLDKWALRPEVGYLFKPGETGAVWNFGIGIQFMLPVSRR